jgi:hypothetical protein
MHLPFETSYGVLKASSLAFYGCRASGTLVRRTNYVTCTVFVFLWSIILWWPAMGHLQFALDAREGTVLGNRVFGFNATVITGLAGGIVGLILTILTILQHFVRTICYSRGELCGKVLTGLVNE